MASSGLEQIVPGAQINSPDIFAPLQNENPESEPSRALFHTEQNYDYLDINVVPTNEYGIVIPPLPTECIGQDCKFCNGDYPCELTRHHLHSTALYYEKAGEVAKQFRNLNVLTVWLPKCQHDIHHNNLDDKVVPIPSLDVMQQCIEEARILRQLTSNQKVQINIEKELVHPDLTVREKNGVRKYEHKLKVSQKELLEEVKTIEVIPEEIVTGVLLFAAPNHGRSRIIMGSDYGLTGTMDKDYVPQAISVANLALEKNSLTAAA